MPYTVNKVLSALDDAGGYLSEAHMAAVRLRARLGYTAGEDELRDLADILRAIDAARQCHYEARREAGERK